MNRDSDWLDTFQRYTAALEEFDRASRTLTDALTDQTTPLEDLQDLFTAEARARDAVVLIRTRLLNLLRHV